MENNQITIQDVINKRKEKTRRADTKLIMRAYEYAVGKHGDQLRKRLDAIAKEKQIDKIVPILKIDAQVDLKDINMEIVESLKQLEPFGEENKVPLFVFKNLKIDSIRALSEGKHIKLTLRQDNQNLINAMGFNLGELTNDYRIGDKVDIVGSLEVNKFNGEESIQILLKDMMKSI